MRLHAPRAAWLAVTVVLGVLVLGRSALADVVRGVLTSVDARGRRIVVKDKDGDHNRLAVGVGAAVSLNGAQAKLESLRAGDSVAVTFSEDARGRATATSIAATRAKKPST